MGQGGFEVHPLSGPHVDGQGEKFVPSHKLAAGPDGVSQWQTGVLPVPSMTLYRWVVQVYAGPFCGVLSGQLAHTAMSKVIVSLPMSPIAPLPCRVLPKKIVDEEVVRQCQSPSLKMLPTSVPPPDNGPHVVPGP